MCSERRPAQARKARQRTATEKGLYQKLLITGPAVEDGDPWRRVLLLERGKKPLPYRKGQGQPPQVMAHGHEPELVVGLLEAAQERPLEMPVALYVPEDGLDADRAPLPELRPPLGVEQERGPPPEAPERRAHGHGPGGAGVLRPEAGIPERAAGA